MDYLDLYLIHFPIALKYVGISERYPAEWVYSLEDKVMVEDEHVSYRETWEAMEELVKEGLVRNIGCCNIGTAMIRELLTYCTIQPAVL